MLEKINFEIGGFFGGFREINVWIENEKMFTSCHGIFNGLSCYYTKEVIAEEIKEIESKLALLKINGWKKRYVDSDILDGTQWSLEYKEQGKKCRHIYGSNDYPEQWNEFIEALGVIVPEVLCEEILR